MRISLIGGIDSLYRHYMEEAKKAGVDLKVFTRLEAGFSSKIKDSEALVIFTSKISHKARSTVMSVANAKDIPVYQCHQCGVCALRDLLTSVKEKGTRSCKGGLIAAEQ